MNNNTQTDEDRADWEGMGQGAYTPRPRLSRWRRTLMKLADRVRTRPRWSRKKSTNASDVMTRDVRTVAMTDTLRRAAQIMWDADCGCVPVVDDAGRVVGMITDRDVCMAAFLKGGALDGLTVMSAAATSVVKGSARDSIDAVEELMRRNHIRRIPIVDEDGRLAGIVSIADVARREPSTDAVARTLRAVSTS
jgi:CBS domain-containing protein